MISKIQSQEVTHFQLQTVNENAGLYIKLEQTYPAHSMYKPKSLFQSVNAWGVEEEERPFLYTEIGSSKILPYLIKFEYLIELFKDFESYK